jgi:hypothetical protein
MSSRGLYRRHTAQFKLQLCSDIRSGGLGRRDAQKKYALSANLLQTWLIHSGAHAALIAQLDPARLRVDTRSRARDYVAFGKAHTASTEVPGITMQAIPRGPSVPSERMSSLKSNVVPTMYMSGT